MRKFAVTTVASHSVRRVHTYCDCLCIKFIRAECRKKAKRHHTMEREYAVTLNTKKIQPRLTFSIKLNDVEPCKYSIGKKKMEESKVFSSAFKLILEWSAF